MFFEMQTKSVVIFSLLWFHVTAPNTASKQNPTYGASGRTAGAARVFGGNETMPHEYPFMVLMVWMKKSGVDNCAGIVIDNEWVMSAAHCSRTQNASSIKFYAGRHNLTAEESTNQEATAVESIWHENYTVSPRATYDIAVIKVTPPFQFNEYVQKVALPKRNDSKYSTGTVLGVGWGMTESEMKLQNLRKVSLPLMTNERCKEIMDPYWPDAIVPVNICAGGVEGEDTCSGDSGGPLLFMEDGRQVVIGITSWGAGEDSTDCGIKDVPGVYTRVTEFMDWIESKTGLDIYGSGRQETSVSRISGGPSNGNVGVGVKISNGLAQTMCKGYDDYQKEKTLAPAFKIKPKTPEKCGWAAWSRCQDGGPCKPFTVVPCKN